MLCEDCLGHLENNMIPCYNTKKNLIPLIYRLIADISVSAYINQQ